MTNEELIKRIDTQITETLNEMNNLSVEDRKNASEGILALVKAKEIMYDIERMNK